MLRGIVDSLSRYSSAIGRVSDPVTYPVEAGHIRRFAEAVGDPNPIYVDEAAARAAGHPRIPAPPTFAAALRPRDPREGLDIDWKKLLHGEQEFTHHRPLYAGDRVTIVQRVADAYVKSGKAGDMDMMVLESTATDEHGAPIFTARSLIVIRR
jgi:acyl dehydratase